MSGTNYPERLKILIVDDERLIADTLAKILNLNGFCAIPAYSGAEAVATARLEFFDVLLTDVVMPEMNGIQLSEKIRNVFPKCTVILMSGNVETEQLLRAAHDQGMDFEIFAKPVYPLVIIDRLNRLAYRSNRHKRELI